MSGRSLLKLAAGIAAAGVGVYAVNRYLVSPDGPIPIAGGFGMDDVAQGAGAVAGIAIVQMLMKKVG